MKLRMNLLVGLLAAVLAFAGVACNGDAADDDFGDPGVETTEDFGGDTDGGLDDGTGTDGGLDDGGLDDGGLDDTGTESTP